MDNEPAENLVMNRELKYVVIDDTIPIIFPKVLVHSDVAGWLGEVTSSGFCQLEPDGWRCWSCPSTAPWSKSSDSDLLNREIGG